MNWNSPITPAHLLVGLIAWWMVDKIYDVGKGLYLFWVSRRILAAQGTQLESLKDLTRRMRESGGGK